MDKGNANEERPLVFVSYAREDNKADATRKGWLDWLCTHLERPLKSATIELFIDNSIITGEYSPPIRTALNRSTAAILLLSPDFMNSKYILEKELPILIERYKAEKLAFFPVLLSHCCRDMVPVSYFLPGDNNTMAEFNLSHLLLPGHDPDHPLDCLSPSDVNKVFKEVTKRMLDYHSHRKRQFAKNKKPDKQKKQINQSTTIVGEDIKTNSTTIVSDKHESGNTTIVSDNQKIKSTTIVPGKQTGESTTIVPEKPVWASSAGRDDYGLFADFTINGITQRMRWIEPGEFLMGSPPDEPERCEDEHQHQVVLSQGFWLADTTCTQRLWQAVMGKNPSFFKGNNRPAENVSWKLAQGFIKKCNNLCRDLSLRLPTEAEWEFACRAGTTTPFFFGSTITTDQVNYNGNFPYNNGKRGLYRETTVDVKSLPCNTLGLFQMHGNVWEWYSDWYDEDYYKHSSVNDPHGPENGVSRVLRGGSWNDYVGDSRSAYRFNYVGFRLARGH